MENAKEVIVEFKGRVNTKSKMTRAVRHGRRKELWKEGVARKIYGKNVIWMG